MVFALSFLIISYLQVLSSKFIKSNHCCFSIYSFHAFLFFAQSEEKWVMVKLFSMKTIDSGAILKSYVDSHGISPKWLALQLNCHRTNLYKIFKKQHLDTFTILKFSEVLEHNFFEDIAVQYTNSQISTDSLPNE